MKFRMISAKDLKEYIGREDILLFDLREKNEYEKEHIKGAVWADWEMLDRDIEKFFHEKKTAVEWIILYCTHGSTSLLAARDLARMGYPVMSLNGGYLGWKARQT